MSHFLYADDPEILSKSRTDLQRSIDTTSSFVKAKHLTISVKRSKTMVFNLTVRSIRETFIFDNEILEPVQSFCYLRFDIKCSGTVKHAMNILNDKGNNA